MIVSLTNNWDPGDYLPGRWDGFVDVGHIIGYLVSGRGGVDDALGVGPDVICLIHK